MTDVAETGVQKPVLLLILDGWGARAETEFNAIAAADCPNWRRMLAECPHTTVHTHGRFVGLPDGQMGNSEVGHMNIGAGRVVYQDLTRIEADVAAGGLARNPALALAFARASAGHTLHMLGLLSPGGVHSHEDQILALLQAAVAAGVERIAVHAFLDGRDTPPQSARASLERLQSVCDQHAQVRIATVSGRYYAMDRDQRWPRVEPAYLAITEAVAGFQAGTALDALDTAYARGENDEFVAPTVIGPGCRVEDGDSVLFMNFRADRARELSQALVLPDFDGFTRPRAITLGAFVTLTEYAADLPVSAVAYAPQSLRNTLPEVLAAAGKRQLRIAETEKYAHVTFFLNGGREQPFPGEDRILVPSPQVATYDLQPEMSLPELSEKLCTAIRSRHYDLIVCNIANPDMVGHTGIFAAAVQAVEAVDRALGDIRAAIAASGGAMLVTADHGNLELMRDPLTGAPHTQHTTGPVPLVYCGRPAKLAAGGALQDLAPTVLALLGIAKPAEMTGRNLIERPD